MNAFTTITDVINWADDQSGLFTDGAATAEQLDKVAEHIRNRAFFAGLTYGDDWSDLLDELTSQELFEVAND